MDKNMKAALKKIGISDFNTLMKLIENNSLENIAKKVISLLSFNKVISEDEKIKMYFGHNLGHFKTQFVGCGTVYDALADIKDNAKDYRWLYDLLEDEASKKTLYCLLLYRLLTNKQFLTECLDVSKQYYDLSLLHPRENEVFVDCGAYDGGSAIDFIKIYQNYKKIYVYEPAPQNFKVITEKLKDYDNLVLFNKAVSDKQGVCTFTSHMPNSANRINPLGDVQVEVSTIDHDIHEPVTFIKMDIESAEPNALLGARNHIVNDKPNLAICVYHTITDLRTIPKIIYSMNPKQKFYLKQHNDKNPEETVLYVSPDLNGDTDADILPDLDQMQKLIQTMEEAFQHTKKLYLNGDVENMRAMLDGISEGLESCGRGIDRIRERIEKLRA